MQVELHKQLKTDEYHLLLIQPKINKSEPEITKIPESSASQAGKE